MAILGIGIFENLVLSKVVVNKSEQGENLDVAFKSTQQASSDGALDFLNSGSLGNSDAGKENNIRFYGISLDKYGDAGKKDGDELLNELLARKDQLTHIALAYLPSDLIKFDLTKGTSITTKDELVKQITKQSTLDKLVDNLYTQFEELLKPFVNNQEDLVVVKFLRKSKASNFPRLADKKLDWNPFISSMKDDKLKAKIKFSDWEKQQGFDSNAQSLDGADSSDASTLAAQTEAVKSVFGN